MTIMQKLTSLMVLLTYSLHLCAQCPSNYRPKADYSLPYNDICSGETIEVIGVGANKPACLYIWHWGDGHIDTLDSNADVEHRYFLETLDTCLLPDQGITFFLQLEVVNLACPDQPNAVIKPVTVYSSIDIEIVVPEFMCDEDLSASFSVIGCMMETETNFFWDFGDPASGLDNFAETRRPYHQFSAPGTYVVTLGFDQSCPDYSFTKSITIADASAPTAIPDNITFYNLQPQRLNVLENDFFSFIQNPKIEIISPPEHGHWKIIQDTMISYAPPPHYTGSGFEKLTYRLCSPDCVTLDLCSTAEVTISLQMNQSNDIFIPNLFSPNGDTANDQFVIPVLRDHPADYNSNELLVWDNCAVLVYRAKPYQNDWDGRNMNGEELPVGTYVYRWFPGNHPPRKGKITLIR